MTLSSSEKDRYKPMLPDALRRFSQPLLRQLLLQLANYQVTIEGTLPSQPSILALYPHGEHANHFLLPTGNIVYLAAADYWFGAHAWRSLLISFVGNNTPVNRDQVLVSEMTRQKKILDAGFHLGVYPQGTRAGAASSVDEMVEPHPPGELGTHLKPGVVRLASLFQVPLVPVGLEYPEWYQPSKSSGVNAWNRLKAGDRQPVPISVRIGEPQEVGRRADSARALRTLAQSLFALTSPSAR